MAEEGAKTPGNSPGIVWMRKLTSEFSPVPAPRLDPLTRQETLLVVSLNANEILEGFLNKVPYILNGC